MCGRFFIDADTDFLLNYFHIHPKVKSQIHLEKKVVFPADQAPVIIFHGDEYRMGMMKWGLPLNGKSSPLINSRIESVLEKPFYREAIEKRRCIIPVSGFFEWSEQKIQHTITSDQAVFGLAGIYQKTQTASGETEWCFSVLTKEANAVISPIHSRMPLTLSPEAHALWLQKTLSMDELVHLWHADSMRLHLERT